MDWKELLTEIAFRALAAVVVTLIGVALGFQFAHMAIGCTIGATVGFFMRHGVELRAYFTARSEGRLLTDDELDVLGQLYEVKYLHPDDIKPEVIASLFRHGLVRPEGSEIMLSELGLRLMDGAKLLAERGA